MHTEISKAHTCVAGSEFRNWEVVFVLQVPLIRAPYCIVDVAVTGCAAIGAVPDLATSTFATAWNATWEIIGLYVPPLHPERRPYVSHVGILDSSGKTLPFQELLALLRVLDDCDHVVHGDFVGQFCNILAPPFKSRYKCPSLLVVTWKCKLHLKIYIVLCLMLTSEEMHCCRR